MLVCKRVEEKKRKRQKKKESQSGRGFVNSIINKLPVELHIPGYQYCGPGTKLAKRLARGDSGINPLDAACKEHDIAYSQNRENLEARHAADLILAEKAQNRISAKDSSLGEKAAAWAIAKTMKIKRKLGMGTNKKTSIKKRKSGKGSAKKIPLRRIVDAAKTSMQPGASAVKTALKGARVLQVLQRL
uniref:Phospholipase A2-like domain-containing protein n=1 Tax=Bracon brevicornis TaxID=1563983 RepID=A0A6V7KM53_9HYME